MSKIELLTNKAWLDEQYWDNKRSFADIAEELGTNRQRVRRAYLKLGGQVRNKSDAQRLALKESRAKHPTQGKKLSDETKLKISRSVVKYWDGLLESELEEISERAKAQCNAMTDEQKEELHKKAAEGIRRAAKEGSALEKDIHTHLIQNGFDARMHIEQLVMNTKLQMDLLVESHGTVIEIDGPSHFLPIWGDEQLAKSMRADAEKNGLLINAGFYVIRVKQMTCKMNLALVQDLVDKLVVELNNIQQGNTKNKLIELEI